MPFIIFPSKAEAEAVAKECHEHLKKTVSGYAADRWADVEVSDLGAASLYVDEKVRAVTDAKPGATLIEKMVDESFASVRLEKELTTPKPVEKPVVYPAKTKAIIAALEAAVKRHPEDKRISDKLAEVKAGATIVKLASAEDLGKKGIK